MTDLSLIQYVLIGCVFIWSGFVRSGLGFGGAVLADIMKDKDAFWMSRKEYQENGLQAVLKKCF